MPIQENTGQNRANKMVAEIQKFSQRTFVEQLESAGNLEPIPEPTGKFVVENATGIQLEDGMYYHYADVCRLLRKYERKLRGIE